MRQIKFRAWDVYKKKFIPTDVWQIYPEPDSRATAVMTRDWEEYKEGECFYPENQVIQQFTGLLDKNGKEIYEGDIFDTYVGSNDFPVHKKIIIEMAFGQWGYFEPHYKVGENWVGTYMERECSKINGGIGYIWNPLINFPMSEGVLLASNPKKEEYINIEVIGNIYENPELLQEAQ